MVPLLAIVRFTALTPLTWFEGPVRRWVYQHASAMVMDPAYVRPMPTKEMLRVWRLQEFLVWLFCMTVGVLVARGLFADVPPEAFDRPFKYAVLHWGFLVQAYATALFVVMVNNVRTLGRIGLRTTAAS